MRHISISLGSFIRQPVLAASDAARSGMHVHCLGHITTPTLQICPQNTGVIDEATLDAVMRSHPESSIRFHANVQMLPQRLLQDVVDFDTCHPYWKRMKVLTQYAELPVYSAHAGLRRDRDMRYVLDQQARLMDFLGIPVALEGHYPTRDNHYLASDWAEWDMMYQSGLPYVVDLSHAAIIANLKHQREDALLINMLSHPSCLEVHLSGNDGRADQHTAMHGHEWWWPLLKYTHSQAEGFYEGVFRL
jgi:hypothetical protein